MPVIIILEIKIARIDDQPILRYVCIHSEQGPLYQRELKAESR
jgi:hypothetical protein